MRLPHPRFTVRRMMAVVALVAIGLGTTDLWQRWRTYRHLAWVYEYRETKRLWGIESATEAMRRSPANKEVFTDLIAEDRQAVEYLARLKTKYRRAGSRPWIAVPPRPTGT